MLQMAHIIITITINIIIIISMTIKNSHPRKEKENLSEEIFSATKGNRVNRNLGQSDDWSPSHYLADNDEEDGDASDLWLDPCFIIQTGATPTPQTAEHCIADCSSLWIIHRASYLTRYNCYSRSNCFICFWVELTDGSVAKWHHCHLFQKHHQAPWLLYTCVHTYPITQVRVNYHWKLI